MTTGWTQRTGPRGPNGQSVTLVEGSTFCISDARGDIVGEDPRGLFVRDTRVLSIWCLLLDGELLVPMSAQHPDPFSATFISRGHPRQGFADSTLLVVRERAVGDGMVETVTLRNLGDRDARVDLALVVDADFADIFAVKEDRAAPLGPVTRTAETSGLRFGATSHGRQRGLVVAADPPGGVVDDDGFRWAVDLPARSRWRTRLDVMPLTDGHEITPRHRDGDAVPVPRASIRLREWRRRSTVVTSPGTDLDETFLRSVEDLGALRIFDPAHPQRAVVAAGAPWFMALFGRDSLLTSWMLLPLDRHLALGTLRTLAEHQGEKVDDVTEEQPGRILHEVRFGTESALWLGGRNVYYGTVDATPLFVMLVGELRRWGADRADIAALLPHVDRALDWITRYGDRDGDGFVEYERTGPHGLVNQGWKDSGNSVMTADGRPVRTPIALAEVQGYVYAAYRARAALARDAGDEHTQTRWDGAAEDLRRRFNEAFWLPERGWYALALDGDKRPVDALASNMGHCLWTGIVEEDKAAAVAAHLLSPAMFSGWGVRTLAITGAAYNPLSYHNGSVWPHDNAIIAAGLARYGFRHEAARIATAQLTVAEYFGGRLPELFCGFDRDEFGEPVPYPAACSPQAWASAAPFLLLRALLGLEPDAPDGVVRLEPAVPRRLLPLTVDNVLLGQERATVHVAENGAVHVSGLPQDLRVLGNGWSSPVDAGSAQRARS